MVISSKEYFMFTIVFKLTSMYVFSVQITEDSHSHTQHYPASTMSGSGTNAPYILKGVSSSPSLQSQQQTIGMTANFSQQDPSNISRPTSAGPNSAMSQYEQFVQRTQPSVPVKNKSFLTDRYGLLGLLSVLRMTDPDLTVLALGTDLTALGLNLNSPECLYSTFASPWADGPSRREPEYYIPMCYYMQNPLQLPITKMGLFSDDTLFYIFYSMPKDVLQVAASAELFKREWRYHKELKLWFTRVTGVEPSAKTNTFERGSYIYFDVGLWEKVRKDNFVLAYDQLETSPPILPVS